MKNDIEFILSIILAIVFFLTITIIGLRTDILRESSIENKPYSFHKFQLWVWASIIIPTFVLYWGFVEGHVPAINESALVLLGISAASAVTAQVVSSSQQANPGNNPSLKSLNLSSTGFWSDILKDDTGQLSIGRLQQLLFTFAFIAIYLTAFFQEMKYPEFDDKAYLLMGISSGTYLIGKGQNK